MKLKDKVSSITYVVVFVICIIMIGCLSCKNMINFYVNDEVDYNEWTADLGNKFETDIATTFFEKFQFVNLNGAVRNVLGQHEMNGIIKLNNGYLHTSIPYSSDKYLQNCAERLNSFKTYLTNRGTSVVYATTPYKVSKYDPQIPKGVEDYGNDNIDRFLEMLKALDIDTIDFRETMHQDGIDQYSMMYKTDHHWTTKAGFYAYGVLEDYIKEQIGCIVDSRISDINNYTVTTYNDWHLGSEGQRTGIYYAGIDDFDLIIPNFETTIQNDWGGIGRMQDIVINMAPLSNKQYTSRYTYDHVLDASLGHFVNLSCPNTTKVLMITDSFGKAVNPYMLMGFSEITTVYEANSSSITPEYIEAFDPDVVILMYYPTFLQESGNYTAFNFTGFIN